MNNQTKINALKIAVNKLIELDFHITDMNTISNLNCIRRELEQSNNKDNIDDWSNRELFDYCVENQLIETSDFNSWNNTFCRNLLLNFINTSKSQK